MPQDLTKIHYKTEQFESLNIIYKKLKKLVNFNNLSIIHLQKSELEEEFCLFYIKNRAHLVDQTSETNITYEYLKKLKVIIDLKIKQSKVSVIKLNIESNIYNLFFFNRELYRKMIYDISCFIKSEVFRFNLGTLPYELREIIENTASINK